MKPINFSQKGLITYTMAGYPDLSTTLKVILAMQKSGVSAIELGIPYSDPVADGPIINDAALYALSCGMNLDLIFDMLEKNRNQIKVPVYLMSYYSPIYTYGVESFIRRCTESGVSGTIIPDLPLPDGAFVFETLKQSGLDPILLAFPNTSEERLRQIDKAGGSFLYYVNLFGTTGVRNAIPEESMKALKTVRKIVSKPVFAGFGISNSTMFRAITNETDGAIIGSAIVQILADNIGDADQAAYKVGQFISSVLA